MVWSSLFVVALCFFASSVLGAQLRRTDELDCTSRPNGLYPNVKNCSTFFKCSWGLSYLYDCSNSLHFNPTLLVCDYPENAGCIVGQTEAPPSTTTKATTTTRAPIDEFDCSARPSGLYPNPKECTTFYKCSNGNTYLYDCPANLHFNPVLLVCDYPESAGCAAGPETPEPTQVPTTEVPSPTTTTLPSTEEFDCSDKPNGLYPNPIECTTFYKCSNGNAYLYDCPANLHFNPSLLICDYPKDAGCTVLLTTPATTEGPITTRPTRPPTDGLDCFDLPNGLYPNPENCESFYKCSNGFSYLYDCPANLHFNPILLVCDYVENAGCTIGLTTAAPTTEALTTQASTTETPTTQAPTTEAPTTNAPTTNAPTTNVTTTQASTTQASTTQVSTTQASTTNASTTEEQSTNPPTTNTTTTQAPDFCVGKPCGTYPEPGTCNGYITCSDGVGSVNQCPEPLLFNQAIGTCDLADRVKCDFSCENRPNGLYQNFENCHTFFKCIGGNSYLYDCASNTVYRPDVKYCDYPENAMHFCVNGEY